MKLFRRIFWLTRPGPGEFFRSRDGNFAMTAGLLMIPLLGAAGMAIDVASLAQSKVDLQNVVDAAVLAAAAKKATTSVVDKDLALSYFNGHSKGMSVNSLNFDENSDGTLTGTASISIKTHFMHIFGKDSMSLSLSSTANAVAETKLSQVTLNIEHAQGAFSKDIAFFTRNAAGTILSESLVLQYRYDGKNRKLIPPSNESITVNVGDYATYGYSMVVYEDTKYKGALVNPRKHYSDDADSAKWIRTSRTCDDPNGILNQWEDGGDANFLDFQFTQKCSSTTTKVTDVRLVK
ncbi:MAG: pilus assembly protein TadG-related protein [Parvibaculum sp.]|uniref:pilus assembly protein TadG-related protein n=1 Tax=Parvibaculum sp. TaxID=2024848 RepID=UPI002730F2F5|nr:pilus assembly protein TadG-related protein [Parvibaculum sp.]MDP2149379.1 pilus assembly protein TadG-related protein [Parvibaculum sp.]